MAASELAAACVYKQGEGEEGGREGKTKERQRLRVEPIPGGGAA